MKPPLLVFAPKEDTDIILRKPNFRSHPEPLPEAADPDATEEENEDEKGKHKEQDDQKELERPASEEFKDVTSSIQSRGDPKNLKPFYEHDACYGRFEAKAFEYSAEALLILLDIMHGHHRRVPKTMELSLLTEIAILVDYYMCHEIVEMFAENWIASVIQEDEIEGSDCQANISRLFISWVFEKTELFNSIVYSILKLAARPIRTDLPLPSTILGKLTGTTQTESHAKVPGQSLRATRFVLEQ
ncbi:hypothetical protein FOWG_11733 [Fusarium oxysporum f. sp. lycopersici MN25]|nr:hypothetical protein FOWG_11733 [Fusarium oxysporum f. sp. lycopersici MN25]